MTRFACALLVVSALASCHGIPKDALRLSEVSLERRQIQTRRFDSTDEAKILSASAGLLQDLGFNLDESDTGVGLIVASKERSAKSTGKIIGSYLLAFFGSEPIYDVRQRLRASVVTRDAGVDSEQIAVRVTFQRTVWDNKDRVSKIEGLFEPEFYREFFDKLSKAVFLEAHEI